MSGSCWLPSGSSWCSRASLSSSGHASPTRAGGVGALVYMSNPQFYAFIASTRTRRWHWPSQRPLSISCCLGRPSPSGHGEAVTAARTVLHRRGGRDAPPDRMAHGRLRRGLGDRARSLRPIPQGRRTHDERISHGRHARSARCLSGARASTTGPMACAGSHHGDRGRRECRRRHGLDTLRGQPANPVRRPHPLVSVRGLRVVGGQSAREPAALHQRCGWGDPDLGQRLDPGFDGRLVPAPGPLPLQRGLQAQCPRRTTPLPARESSRPPIRP